jgi:hypothetical protein
MRLKSSPQTAQLARKSSSPENSFPLPHRGHRQVSAARTTLTGCSSLNTPPKIQTFFDSFFQK